jgi:hypothetical protein
MEKLIFYIGLATIFTWLLVALISLTRFISRICWKIKVRKICNKIETDDDTPICFETTITRAVKENNPQMLFSESNTTIDDYEKAAPIPDSCLTKTNPAIFNDLGCRGLKCHDCIFFQCTNTTESVLKWMRGEQ